MSKNQDTSLKYLFFTFLKIGAISWGGFMALISVVQQQLVEKDKKVADGVILDSISLASVLPGPLAFNVVSYLGYYLRGIKGALVSMVAILLPSFFLILILTYVYFVYDQVPAFNNFFLGVLPAVAAIIISVAANMSKKNIKDYRQVIILVFSGLSLVLFRSFYTTMLIMAVGGISGYFFYRNTISTDNKTVPVKIKLNFRVLISGVLGIAGLVLLIWLLPVFFQGENSGKATMVRDISLTFSGMSLTLFGGGYVIIPAIQEIVVDGLNWLNTNEFSDAIAMGQITPGPIFISATFIGYKVGGLLGAIAATIAIFFPPAFFMIFCSRFIDQIKRSKTISAIFKGLRPAVIGMIFAAAFTIGRGVELNWQTILLFASVLVLSIKFKINVAYLIPISGLAGVLLFA
ncbi:chromate efflux transporter [Prolixibacteraceae bacterium Z1-6]|uniref:Chromate efflux transporter n=1 Tax=Draconibacterium aestuarii TaxID=2998507 RepID=A0A9X3F793_9BACT|nr:chromate efflux transporter [Prolixibacteraceae bacterium Z1-6]